MVWTSNGNFPFSANKPESIHFTGDHIVLLKTPLSNLNVIGFYFCLVITMLPFRAPNFLLATYRKFRGND